MFLALVLDAVAIAAQVIVGRMLGAGDDRGAHAAAGRMIFWSTLLGLVFVVFGLNGFLNFISMPPPGGIAGQFMGALYASHYVVVIFGFQIIAAVLLLVNRYVPLAVAVLAPVIVNILSFHALMAPSGLPLALFVAVLWALIFVEVRAAFAALFQPRLQGRA